MGENSDLALPELGSVSPCVSVQEVGTKREEAVMDL